LVLLFVEGWIRQISISRVYKLHWYGTEVWNQTGIYPALGNYLNSQIALTR